MVVEKELNTSNNRKKIVDAIAMNRVDPLYATEQKIKLENLNLLTKNQEKKAKRKLDIEEVVISNSHFSYSIKGDKNV